MKNKFFRYIIMALFLIFLGNMITVRPTYAASAEVNLTSDVNEVTVGDKIFVYININSSTQFGNFEANLTYDDDLLEYKKGSSVITGDSGFLRISDMSVTQGDKSRKYTLEFKALEAGVCEISFSGRAIVYDIENEKEMSVSSNILNLSIKAPEKASENANLKSLKISPSQLTPEFSANTYEYSVKVGNETDQLIISALPEDEKATVSVSGNDFLKEGENKIVITVLAESGDVIKYNINVFREVSEEPNDLEEQEDTLETVQKTFDIVTTDEGQYLVYSGKYQLIQPQSDVSIPKGYQESSLTIEGTSIPVYVPIENETSEFILVYVENEYGEKGFYQFDRIEKTLQRYNLDNVLSTDDQNEDLDQGALTEEYNSNLSKAAIVIALLSAFCILMIIVIIRLLLKQKSSRQQ